MRSILTFLLFLSFINASAQDEYNSDSIDYKTQKLIDNKKWNDLIKYGERALHNQVESYLLRTRLGIAYFAVKNYFKAIPNFEKALSISSDPQTSEYLYYSYLFTGRDEDKNYIFYDLPKGLRKKLKPLENSIVDNIHAGYVKGYSNDIEKNAGLDLQVINSDFGEQTLNGDYNIFRIGLSQLPLRFLNVTYNYIYKKESKEKQIQSKELKITDKYFQYHDQFYNSFDIRIANGLAISIAGHYISIKDSTYYPDYNNFSFADIPKKENISKNFVLSFNAAKYFSIFNIGINGSFSYLNNKHQSQYGLYFKSFPFSMVSFYALTNLILHKQQNISNLIVTQLFGGRVKKLLYEAYLSYGRMNNYNEQNGFLIYDDPDIIKYKFGAELKYNFSNNLSAYFSYDFQYRERDYVILNPFNLKNQIRENKKANYNISSLLIGLNFIF
ncbi:MAG: hypothetical protein ABI792_08720 [bacterium]